MTVNGLLVGGKEDFSLVAVKSIIAEGGESGVFDFRQVEQHIHLIAGFVTVPDYFTALLQGRIMQSIVHGTKPGNGF